MEKEVRGEELNIRDMSGNRTLVSFDTGDFVTVQAGKKRMRQFGSVDIPQEAFISALKMDS